MLCCARARNLIANQNLMNKKPNESNIVLYDVMIFLKLGYLRIHNPCSYRYMIFKLKQLKGIGNKGLLRLLSFYLDFPNGAHSAENYLKIGKVNKKYKDIFLDSYKQIENIHFDDYLSFTELYPFVTIMEDEYPECLREIYNPPIAFFYFGDITLLNHPKNLFLKESYPEVLAFISETRSSHSCSLNTKRRLSGNS